MNVRWLLRQVFLIPLVLLTVFMWHGKASADEFDLRLTWTDLADNEERFEIERSATGASGPFDYIDEVGEDETSYTDAGLTDHIPYCYRVQACNAAGCSAFRVVCPYRDFPLITNYPPRKYMSHLLVFSNLVPPIGRSQKNFTREVRKILQTSPDGRY